LAFGASKSDLFNGPFGLSCQFRDYLEMQTMLKPTKFVLEKCNTNEMS